MAKPAVTKTSPARPRRQRAASAAGTPMVTAIATEKAQANKAVASKAKPTTPQPAQPKTATAQRAGKAATAKASATVAVSGGTTKPIKQTTTKQTAVATPVKRAPGRPAKAIKVVNQSAVKATDKPVKIKMERDSFTMPKDEYAQIAELKKRLERAGQPAKKSELLRAGLALLSKMDDAALAASLAAIPTIKTGRPKS